MTESICGMSRRIVSITLALTAVCIHFTCQRTSAEDLTAKVVLTSDGPTILGATTTFTATLSLNGCTAEAPTPDNKMATKGEPTYLYVYFWKQSICGERRVAEIKQNDSCNFTQTYRCPEDIGSHEVIVDVRKNTFIVKPLVVSNTTALQITEHINAKLSIKQGVSCNSSFDSGTCNVVATNTSVDMVVDIHDPSNFFQGAAVLYHWTFGDGIAETTINQPALSHMYQKPGHYGITVNMTAIFPDDTIESMPPKTGNIQQNLKTMDAVRNLTIKGRGNILAGVKASYNISCLASLPVEFCWYVIPITTLATQRGHSDILACNKMVLTNMTWFEVHQWFNKSGGYSIGVQAHNAISIAKSNKQIHVKRTASPVIGLVIGVLFGIAGCFLCMTVIANHVRGRRQRHVEVANFDFQNESSRSATLSTRIWQLITGGTREERVPLSQDFNRSRAL